MPCATRMQRRDLDGGFTRQALDPILDLLDGTRASIYLVGEIADWAPGRAGKNHRRRA